jgi:hypothetical protein
MNPFRSAPLSAVIALALARAAAAASDAGGPVTAPAGEPIAAAEVPPRVLETARTALAARLAGTGVTDPPVLVRAEAVTWPDGSLGCDAPGAARTPALVPGYRLVFEAGGRRYEYHASGAGAVVACERRRGPRAVPPPRA